MLEERGTQRSARDSRAGIPRILWRQMNDPLMFLAPAPYCPGLLHALYDAVTSTDNARALTFLAQWKILFGEVCGSMWTPR